MCGATTAWSHLLRGQPLRAALANLGGTLLAVVAAIASPWLLLTGTRGRWPIVRPTLRATLLIASAWLAVVVLDWLRRICLDL